MSEHLTGTLATILDSARAEAKRFDHPRTHPLHLAAALFRRDPGQFEQDFGGDADERVLAALGRLQFDSDGNDDEAATIELINSVRGADNPWTAVAEALRPTVESLGAVVSEGSKRDAEQGGPQDDVAPVAASRTRLVGGDRIGGGMLREGHDTPPAVAIEAEPASFEIPTRSRPLVDIVKGDDSVVEHRDVVDHVLEVMGRRDPGTACVVAEPGAGRTSLLGALARRLATGTSPSSLAGRPLVRVSPEAVLASDRSHALRRVLDDVGPAGILALDDIEVLGSLGSPSIDVDMLGVIRSVVARDGGAIVTLDAGYLNKLEVHNHELLEELTVIELPPLEGAELETLIGQHRSALESFHGVSIGDDVARLAAAPPSPEDRRVHPGLAVDRLDAACARAQGRGDRRVGAADVQLGPRVAVAGRLDRDALVGRLRHVIKGQDRAVESVVERLALTRADLDLNPERPDGVFLFAGPTGVGKTALARALSEVLSTGAGGLIRLDMSEYNDEWAVSRLTGPQPGYVGYTEPEGWLTTKVRERPDAVVLLDEIEKAHPTVWNTFLQVFDAGRLTDARGNVARFAKTVVVMTSNIGSEAFSASSVGFLEQRPDAAASEAGVIRAVESRMVPELVNRLDQIIVFQPLSESSITEIAAVEIAGTLERLRERGYELEVSPEVVEFVAKTGYDVRYGARHLQRNIERLLLQPLVGHEPGELQAKVVHGAIRLDIT